MSTGFESKIEGGCTREITHLECYVFYVNSIAPLGINASRKGVKRLEKKQIQMPIVFQLDTVGIYETQ